MYSILIADDEKYVRQDIIRSVNWTDHGYFIVGEASNGAQALEKIKELQPDVLITDIRMPLTDGLSLIERALKLQPNLHSVIVSGYEDFHYAREAIRLNVLDYLTKPIDETSILSMLQKLTTALEGDNHNRTSAPAFSMPNKEGSFSAGSTAAAGGNLHYAVISLYFASCFLQKTRKYTENLFASWLSHAVHSHSDFIDDPCFGTQFCYMSPTLMQITVYAGHLTKDHLQHLLKYLQEQLSLCGFPVPATALTPPFPDKTRLSTLQTSCLQLLNSRLLFESDLIWYRLIPPQKEAFVSEITELMEQFRKNISIRHFENTEYYLNQMLKSDNKEAFTPELLEYVICEISNTLRKICLCYQLTINQNIFKEPLTPFYLMAFSELEALRKDLLKRCKAVFSFVNAADSIDVITLIKQYIQKNYEQDITLVSIASEFFFNPSYLSHMFKQQTGGNLSSYIEEIRIKEALKLFRTQKLSIGKVARMVGYNDPNYFSKIFRKRTGFSPAAYTKQDGGNDNVQ